MNDIIPSYMYNYKTRQVNECHSSVSIVKYNIFVDLDGEEYESLYFLSQNIFHNDSFLT